MTMSLLTVLGALALPVLIVPLVLVGPGARAQSESSQPWYETLPAVAMDYKVHIDAGKEDCYFQYANPGATFYVNFQVLRGGDGKAGFAVRNPHGDIVFPYQWRANADYQDQSTQGGYYCVCVDNQFSKFASKLVNIYITVIRYDQWEKYAQELEDLNLSVINVTNTMVSVEKNIYEVLQIQHFSRSREDRDYNLLLDNKSYVQNWSILQIIVIVATTVLQVYFVRRLFEVRGGYSRSRI
ncbi:PREDICTED: transmembrane emp24 domain-containing protein 1 [Ceratosolen solmsi marchali]|uniref:Transmembrane emp24 domain-containing protein 1 n=1 Tax=Ceratosolen solmsi marchali TaxID=326594 RepID=A0AAJ6YMH1_9HYME|nr:PREDICTED: transmembrane emp24 domain-containing protein 1 [Ceratosolen solmsi marchali]